MRSEFHETVSVLKCLPERGVFNSHLLWVKNGNFLFSFHTLNFRELLRNISLDAVFILRRNRL